MNKKKNKTKSVSIKDIAKDLNVSTTLVSLVLNNKSKEYSISDITKEKVLAKAKELNYKPNRAALSLRLGHTKNIGLIVPDISNIFYSRISRYFSDLVDKKGYNLMIYNTDENPEKEKKIIDSLLEQNVDGIILTSTCMNQSEINILRENNIPYILVDRYIQGIEASFVGVNNYQGTKDAIEYLIQQNISKIAYITVDPTSVSSLDERKKAYHDTLKKHKITPNPRYEITLSYDNIEKDVENKIFNLFRSEESPEAVFIANNKAAIETLKRLKSLKTSVTQDLKIVCFDNIPLYDVLPYPVTSVSQPILQICNKASEILFNEILNGEADEQKILLPAVLIVRN